MGWKVVVEYAALAAWVGAFAWALVDRQDELTAVAVLGTAFPAWIAGWRVLARQGCSRRGARFSSSTAMLLPLVIAAFPGVYLIFSRLRGSEREEALSVAILAVGSVVAAVWWRDWYRRTSRKKKITSDSGAASRRKNAKF